MADATPKKKKLPFKPTALRKAAAPTATASTDSKKDEDDDGLSLFRRAKEMEPIVAADRERRLKKKKQKHASPGERRSSAAEKRRLDEDSEALPSDDGVDSATLPIEDSMTVKTDSFNELATPPASKRSRTESSSSSSKRPLSSASIPAVEPDGSPSSRRSRSHTKPKTPKKPSTANQITSSAIISLDSDDEGVDQPIDNLLETVREPSVELVEDPQPQVSREPQEKEEEDEFAEYVRKAEEARKRQLASQTSAGEKTSNAGKVEILVTSTIEGSRDSRFKVFLDKPLAQVRSAWLAIQAKHKVNLPVDPSDLILTWKRTKVYNYSTLQNLGLRSYGDGVIADGYSRRGMNADGTQVHMEIWTPDLFKQWEEEEEYRRKVQAGELSDQEDTVAEPEEPEIKLKIILRARDLEEVKLTVRPETTVETLVTGFKAQRGLGPDKEVTLWFDGDMMEEHTTMQDADIDDMDTIEVHIK